MAHLTWLCQLALTAVLFNQPSLATPTPSVRTPSLIERATFQEKCLAFSPQTQITNSTLTRREYVTSGTTLTFPDNDSTCGRASQAVTTNLCRIALSIPTTYRSSITYELWLPETWTGRILATGNGGIDGCVKYEDLEYGARNGFATYGSNNGKNGTSGLAFLGNPDIVKDFSYRALHTSVESSKKLIKLFYAQDFGKSYYLGCSLGGRMGIDSATRYPNDFHGVVAGAPAVDFNNLVSARASYFPITGNTTSANFITTALWSNIHDEILTQCDSLDGVADGILEDPNKCKFDPSKMLCSSTLTTKCLTAAQVAIVKKVFQPFTYPSTGIVIFPAMQPGSEVLAATRLYAGAPFAYSEDWFKYTVYGAINWLASTFSWVDALYSELLNPSDIRTYPKLADLTTFRKSSGKIITYHGTQDNQITIYNSERFYKRLVSNGSAQSIADFYRFFRVPGMNHCNGGPGAWVLGQGGNAPAAGIGFEADSNVLASMVRWVEQGVAPESVIGTKFVSDIVSLGVSYRKRHCLYPTTSTYIGGDPKQINSWKCV